jgi:hypothetical protein
MQPGGGAPRRKTPPQPRVPQGAPSRGQPGHDAPVKAPPQWIPPLAADTTQGATAVATGPPADPTAGAAAPVLAPPLQAAAAPPSAPSETLCSLLSQYVRAYLGVDPKHRKAFSHRGGTLIRAVFDIRKGCLLFRNDEQSMLFAEGIALVALLGPDCMIYVDPGNHIYAAVAADLLASGEYGAHGWKAICDAMEAVLAPPEAGGAYLVPLQVQQLSTAWLGTLMSSARPTFGICLRPSTSSPRPAPPR